MKNNIGYNYLNKIEKILKGIFYNKFSLLLGGGLGYESKKYYEYGKKIDDIDLFLSIYNINSLKNIDYTIFSSIGFEIDNFLNNLNIDIDLFNNNYISVIRLTGKIDGIKCSINISTYNKLLEIFSKGGKINKVAHTKTYCMFKSYGLYGNNIMVGMFPVDISNKYDDGKKHYLISDFSYLKLGNENYLGLFTDFITKGKILVDNNKLLFKIQEKILLFILENTNIKDLEKLINIFASSDLFSSNFSDYLIKKFLNIKLKNNIKDYNKSYKSYKIYGEYITIFPDKVDFLINKKYNMDVNYNNINLKKIKNYLENDIVNKFYDFYLYIELYKYSSLLNNFIFKENIYYKDVSLDNTTLNENLEYNFLRNELNKYDNIFNLFIDSINKLNIIKILSQFI